MYHLHLHCSPSSPLPTHLPLKCCLWLRSERSGKRTPHTPHRWWQHETSAAFLCAEGLRFGENHESHWPARSGGELLRLRRGSRGEWEWRVTRAGPGAAWCVPQFPRTSVDATETISEAPGYPKEEWHPCLVKLCSFFSRERRGAIFQCSQLWSQHNSTGGAIVVISWPSPSKSCEG